jgi:hypothetical protein
MHLIGGSMKLIAFCVLDEDCCAGLLGDAVWARDDDDMFDIPACRCI